LEYKYKDGQSKWCLRQILYKYVPAELIERPKKGFGVPLASWLRGPLREWADALLDEKRLQLEGFFDVKIIRRIWLEHLSTKYNHENKLWTILMFQSWLNENARK
jgi:asparagine synthase (glutamine-hydrolysing)